MKQKEKPKYTIFQNLAFLLRCSWRVRRSVPIVCVALALVDAALNLYQLFIAPAILRKVETHAPLSELLLTIALFTLAGFFLLALQRYGNQNRMSGEIDVRCEVIRLMSQKSGTTSFPNTRNPEIGKMKEEAFRASDDNRSATEHTWRTLSRILTGLIGLVLYLALLSHLDFVMLAVILGTTLISYFVSRKVNAWEYNHREEKNQISLERYYITKISHSNTLAKDIRIFGLADWLRELNEKTIRTLEAFLHRRERVQILGNVMNVLMTFLRNGIAYYYLISLALREGLGASDFLLYFTALSSLTDQVTKLLSQFSELHRESLALSRIQEYLQVPEPFLFEKGAPVPKAEGYELRMEQVTFRYPGTEKNILENINLTIHPGEKLAIVGLNGAGKTTLVFLLCGFYDPDQGRILLNGQDIRSFNRREYYALFSAVFQDYSLLDVTIAEQVAQRADGIDPDRVEACLEKAGLADFVRSLPHQTETHMGRQVYLDGILLSGGQTQRLMLARALYKDGPILLLDEPTAALDPLAENDIYRKYNEMTAGKTSVFISHRLASTRFCDRILFIADGAITEEGTHEELLTRNGAYAHLFEVQSRYYQEGGKADEKEE